MKSKLAIAREQLAWHRGTLAETNRTVYRLEKDIEQLRKRIDFLQSDRSDLQDNILALRTELAFQKVAK